MPSPTAHVYYGQEFLARHLSHDPAAFLRGTVFADIRYLVKMARSQTHLLGVSLNDVRTEMDPWRAGWLFHCWLDEAWADYFGQWGLDRYDHAFDAKLRAVRLIEDDQLHRELKWAPVESVAKDLEHVDSRAVRAGISAEGVLEWNRSVANLLRQMDSVGGREQILRAMHLTSGEIAELEAEERYMGRQRVWQDRVRDCRRVIIGLL